MDPCEDQQPTSSPSSQVCQELTELSVHALCSDASLEEDEVPHLTVSVGLNGRIVSVYLMTLVGLPVSFHYLSSCSQIEL